MTILKIKRKKELSNILTKYEVYIDGQLVGKLSNGETKGFTATEGQHAIIVKLERSERSSQEISINTTEIKYLIVSCTKIYVMMDLLRIVVLGLIGVIFIFFGVRIISRNTVFSLLFYFFIIANGIYFSVSEKILNLEIKQ